MAVSFVAAGTSAAADNANLTPGLPAGVAAGDLLVGVWSPRNTTATATITAGWSSLIYYRNTTGISLATTTKIYAAGDTAPTFTISGGSATDTVTAHIFALRGTSGIVATGTTFQGGGTAVQNIGAITGVTSPAGGAVVVLGAKSDNWTSVATLTGDSLTWAATIPTATTVTDKTYTVTGGAVAVTVGVQLAFGAASIPPVIPRRVPIGALLDL
jgi:hypothetical protein